MVRVVDRTGAAGLTAVDVTRLATLASVEWVIGLSAVGPLARNAAIGGPVEGYARDAVGSRWYWGDLLHSNLVRLRAGRSPRPGEAVAGEQASATLGLADAVGTVDDESAGAVAIVGTVAPAAAVGNLSAYILIRGEGSGAQLREILILVRSSGEVEGLVSRLPGLLAVVDSRSLGVQRAEELLAIRETLANEVGSLNAAVLFASLSTSALLIAILLYGVVEGRRREFGLRRTQGATRTTIAALVLVESLSVSLVGSILGALAGTIVVLLQTSSLADPALTLSITGLVILSALAGSGPPAVNAAMQEPLYVLRSP